MKEQQSATDALNHVKEIHALMQRSSRFISLSGLSGIAAGVCALIGAYVAKFKILAPYYEKYNSAGEYNSYDFSLLKWQLVWLAITVFTVAFISAFYLTWRKSRKLNLPIWDATSRRLFINMVSPIIIGGLFILGMLQYNEWRFVAPACLIFYGLALVNASKYTLTDIRYLGYCEIILGLINMYYIGYGIYFWATGFGLLHIIYGAIMWRKYESN